MNCDPRYREGCQEDNTLPAGGSDTSGGESSLSPEEELKTQRRKTVKTAEALMRAFDDLNRLREYPNHEMIIDKVAGLISKAQNLK